MSNIPNLSKINEEIKGLINPNNQHTIQKYKEELLQAELEIKKKINYKEVKKLQSQIDELKDKIENLENGSYFVEYVTFADQILNEYMGAEFTDKLNKLSPTIQILEDVQRLSADIRRLSADIRRLSVTSDSLETKNNKLEKNTHCISKLLSVARKYINISEIEKKYTFNKIIKPIENKCKNCKSSEEFLVEQHKGFLTCNKCGFQFINSFNYDKQHIDFNANERVNTKQRYKYERSNHFDNVIDEFQGKCKKSIPKTLFIELEKNLDSYKLLINNKSKQQKFSKVTKQHIRRFLKNSNNTKYYKDINYIYHELTNKQVPDISEYIDNLKKDFKSLFKCTYNLKNKRKNKFFKWSICIMSIIKEKWV